jgi:purine-nucleoside phosphorylase
MTIHIAAAPGDIAETVLLPGDPLRAEYVAQRFLEQPTLYNRVRGMLGFTGVYRGHRVSVQGTGMGIPSTLIYANELVREYGVQTLVRIGSAGSLRGDLPLRSVVLAMSACTDSGINRQRFGGADFAPTASFELMERALASARVLGVPLRAGSVLSTDQFYPDNDPEYFRLFAEYGVLCAEMETAGLYTVAAKYGVRALSILTVSDQIFGDHAQGDARALTAEQRERSFDQMIEIALGMLEP